MAPHRRRAIVDAQVHLWKAQAPDRPPIVLPIVPSIVPPIVPPIVPGRPGARTPTPYTYDW